MPIWLPIATAIYFLIPVPFFILFSPDRVHGAVTVGISLIELWTVIEFAHVQNLLLKLKQNAQRSRILRKEEKDALLGILTLRKKHWKTKHLNLGILVSACIFADGLCLGTVLSSQHLSGYFYTFICVQAGLGCMALLFNCLTYINSINAAPETSPQVPTVSGNNDRK